MLFWAMFTVGYIIGVFTTLAIIFQKGRDKQESVDINPLLSSVNEQSDSWDVFHQLTKINYKKEDNISVLSLFKHTNNTQSSVITS